MAGLVEAFAALCKEAENAGTRIGFELMGSSMIDNLADAITLVETAGARNGGLILDIVQVENLHIPFEEIRRIPLEYLFGVELNDGALPGSRLYDPTRARRYCGEGDFDVKGLIALRPADGVQGPLGGGGDVGRAGGAAVGGVEPAGVRDDDGGVWGVGPSIYQLTTWPTILLV